MSLRPEFKLLVWYRWASLIPPLLALATHAPSPTITAFTIATATNALISFFSPQLNTALQRSPAIISLDLLLCAILSALTSGWNTPYYLHSLSPLLAAAFFFQRRGALLSATGIAVLFGLAGLGPLTPDPNVLRLVTQEVGFFLIAGAFGYATSLTARLQTSHAELNRMHRDLEVIHGLTLSLQSASDISEVEERVLTAITRDLGFPQAVILRVDQNEHALTAWVGQTRATSARMAGVLHLPLKPEAGPLVESLLNARGSVSSGEALTADALFNQHIGPQRQHIFPMLLREHPVGVLLVEAAPAEDTARAQSLQAIASQAAVAVGATMLCIDRAQRLAVQDERIRIAREIHDTVSQSLFGLTFSLEACIKLLPGQPETVRAELANLQTLAQAAREELRQSILNIWPSELTAERFVMDLRRYVGGACQAGELDFAIDVRGDFSRLSPRAKRSLYRIAQEAVNNISRHAGAQHARVCLAIDESEAVLAVRDDGRGFEPQTALAREINREHFGLRGIADRAASLGGSSDICSRPGAGATVLVSLPVNGK